MKLGLNERVWKEFSIGGKDGIFEIKSTSSGIDKNKLNLNASEVSIPYITRSEYNNGINLFVPENQHSRYKVDEGNVITVGLDTQTVFYQPHNFLTGQNIQVLKNPMLNKYNALFIVPLLRIQMKKFNWGGNGATLGRLARTKFLLPVNKDNNPDWSFMEQYIRILHTENERKYLEYANSYLNVIQYSDIPTLSDKNWEEFFLTDLFPTIQRGKRLTESNQIKGDTPYISSTAMNNGVDNFISNNKSVRRFNNCITIANSGSVGSSFFHPYEFVASDHVTHLKNEKMNIFIYLFITTMLNRVSNKYNFNREINDQRISREKIVLPINDKGEPDYVYMEQYIKNIMFKKYKKYSTN